MHLRIQQKEAQLFRPRYITEWSSWLLALGWRSPSHHGHLGSEQVGECSLL